jgi:hypothetical protein
MKSLTDYIAKSLVEDPDSVLVTQNRQGNRVRLELKVSKDDMGRVIGKNGRACHPAFCAGWPLSVKGNKSHSCWSPRMANHQQKLENQLAAKGSLYLAVGFLRRPHSVWGNPHEVTVPERQGRTPVF